MSTAEVTDQTYHRIRYPNKRERLLPARSSRLEWSDAATSDVLPPFGKILDSGSAQYQVICDDNRKLLRDLDAGSVDLVVTSPPYFSQREYAAPGLGNEETADEYLDNIVDRFYILTTHHQDDYGQFEPDISQVYQEHGCQLIVNGVDPTLRYYLRLIQSTREFVDAYVTNLETDPSITFQLKETWNEIVAT